MRKGFTEEVTYGGGGCGKGSGSVEFASTVIDNIYISVLVGVEPGRQVGLCTVVTECLKHLVPSLDFLGSRSTMESKI